MEELLEMYVKVTFSGNIGLLVVNGKVKRIWENMFLLQTQKGPMYIMVHAVKTIEIVREEYERS